MIYNRLKSKVNKIINLIVFISISSILIWVLEGIGRVQTAAGDDQGVKVIVKGESWDADSRGFAYFMGLSISEGEKTSARRGSRISVDGQPGKYVIASPGPHFKLTFTTKEKSFGLIIEGDRFPSVLTQPYDVPEGGGEIEIGRIDALRAEGYEHTWPLVMAANELGYATAWEMLADNKAVIRLLVLGSGEDGAPDWTNDATISVNSKDKTQVKPITEPTNAPFLLRVVKTAYVFPFDMNKKDTFFLFNKPSVGAFLIVIPFTDDDELDKDVTIQITDNVTVEMLDPPRPWIYDPITISVRNGFTTPSIRVHPKME